MPIDNRTCFMVNLRDALRCRSCGRGPTEQATYHRGFGYHHITPRSHGGPDTVDNLVLLCKACHDAHHAGRLELHFRPQPPPSVFACHACNCEVNPATVTMNCGWYQCESCRERVHLFEHFVYGREKRC